MHNITYFLGAGASANCLPVINGIDNRFRALQKCLSHYIVGQYLYDNPLGQKAREIINDIEWVLTETGKHQTIDTVAKKLFLNTSTHDKLFKLKKILITLFLFEQNLFPSLLTDSIYLSQLENKKKDSYDKRYDTFLATIINNKIDNLELKGNIKIITWNYDIQFEIALKNYLDKSFNELQVFIQSIPNNQTASNENYNLNYFNFSKFSIIRLNGLAVDTNLKLNTSKESFIDTKFNTLDAFLIGVVDLYFSITDSECDNYFNYSWESIEDFKKKDNGYLQKKNIALKIAQETDILVVIGYSFPIFNRSIDKELIKAMPRLRKIYIQDLNSENVKEIITSIANETSYLSHKNIISTNNVDQFVIPYEID